MTTQSGARIYRRAPKRLEDGACAHCGRVVALSITGRRRHHRTPNGERCTGGGVLVGNPLLVDLTELPPVEMPNTGGNTGPREPRPGKPSCVCGQRPRRKSDGQYAAHRVVVDDPSSPYCPGGAERSY